MADQADQETFQIGRRCYVSNLAWKTSWQDLKDKFRECGNVRYANVTRDEQGRSKGWGIVEFETPEEAAAAVNTLNGTDLGGRPISVREDREDRDIKDYQRENGIERPARPPPRVNGRGRGRGRGRGPPPPPSGKSEQSSGLQVVVHGLPWAFTSEQLQELFEESGAIEKAEVIYGRDNRSRGYGTILFASEEDAQAAIDKHNGTDLEGRTLSVKFDQYA